jgi:hypothetical protein
MWKKLKSRSDAEKEEIIDTNKFVSSLFPDEQRKEQFTKKDIKDIIQVSELNEATVRLLIVNFR